jgi:hypothetical protein
MNAESSPFRQNGVSSLTATGRSGVHKQIDGTGWLRAILCIENQDPRDDARVPLPGPAGPVLRQESEGGIRRRMRRQKADDTDVWARKLRSEQLARRERDWAAHATAWERRMPQHR